MKTITKLFSGLLLASTLMVGFSQNAQCKSITPMAVTEVSATKSSTHKALTKPFTFINDTTVTIAKLEVKTNFDSSFSTVFDKDNALDPGYERSISECTFDDHVKTMDFRISDKYGHSLTLEGLDISSIKNKDKVEFDFEQDGDTFSVSLLK